jgi:hypothetical protein
MDPLTHPSEFFEGDVVVLLEHPGKAHFVLTECEFIDKFVGYNTRTSERYEFHARNLRHVIRCSGRRMALSIAQTSEIIRKAV